MLIGAIFEPVTACLDVPDWLRDNCYRSHDPAGAIGLVLLALLIANLVFWVRSKP